MENKCVNFLHIGGHAGEFVPRLALHRRSAFRNGFRFAQISANILNTYTNKYTILKYIHNIIIGGMIRSTMRKPSHFAKCSLQFKEKIQKITK